MICHQTKCLTLLGILSGGMQLTDKMSGQNAKKFTGQDALQNDSEKVSKDKDITEECLEDNVTRQNTLREKVQNVTQT